jgi:hypothetical protein
MNSPQTTEDNIRLAMAGLTTARKALFFGAKRATDARRNPRIRAVELAICDAIKAAGASGPALDVRSINRQLNSVRKTAERCAEGAR